MSNFLKIIIGLLLDFLKIIDKNIRDKSKNTKTFFITTCFNGFIMCSNPIKIFIIFIWCQIIFLFEYCDLWKMTQH